MYIVFGVFNMFSHTDFCKSRGLESVCLQVYHDCNVYHVSNTTMLNRKLSLSMSGTSCAFAAYVGSRLCIVITVGSVICTEFNVKVGMCIKCERDCFFTYRFFFVGRIGDMSFPAVDSDVSWLSAALVILSNRVLRRVIEL